MMMAARPASMSCKPLKNRALYENTPVNPRSTTGIILSLGTFGSRPSIRQVSGTRQADATRNLRNAAENGPTLSARIFPAIKVPPQKMAVRNNLIYTRIGRP